MFLEVGGFDLSLCLIMLFFCLDVFLGFLGFAREVLFFSLEVFIVRLMVFVFEFFLG